MVPIASDKLKCQLKAVSAADYAISLDAVQTSRLNAAFPSDGCDWSKPGVNQTPVVTYASFGPSPVNPVFQVGGP